MASDQRSDRRVALIACGKAKRQHAAPARELYTSNLFRLSVRWAERYCDDFYVVSAFHGLLDPDTELAPYDRSLADMRQRERDAWADRVTTSFAARERGATVVLLAGGHYRRLAEVMRWSMHPAVNFCRGAVAAVEEPLEGLGIGKRLQWLKGELGVVPDAIALEEIHAVELAESNLPELSELSDSDLLKLGPERATDLAMAVGDRLTQLEASVPNRKRLSAQATEYGAAVRAMRTQDVAAWEDAHRETTVNALAARRWFRREREREEVRALSEARKRPRAAERGVEMPHAGMEPLA